MCNAWITVLPAVRVGSVKLKAGSPNTWVRSVLIAVRSSVTWVARTVVLPAVSGESVKAWAKVAVTNRAAVIGSVQVVVVPLHAPPHCWKLAPEPAFAVSVTIVFTGKACAQIAPQLMPAALLLTILLEGPRAPTRLAEASAGGV